MNDAAPWRQDIHFESHGHGEPILLTHGFGATTRMWDEQIEEFTDRYRLLAWDLPGHGGSAPPEPTITPDDLVERMRMLLDAADAGRIVLIGLGLGGTLSLRFWQAHPTRVRGLVLIGTPPGLRTATARALWNARVDAQADALERDGLDALEGGAEVDPGLHADPRGLLAAARLLPRQNDAGALPFLAEIDVPVLLLVGAEDRPHLAAAHHMARIIPGAHEVVVPRGNHAVNLHKPAAANAAIRGFLARLPP